MTRHHMRLSAGPFEAIKAGHKTVESRLNDSKRRDIAVGDEILFSHSDTGEALLTGVVGLLRYRSFEDMFTHNGPARFGGDSVEKLVSQIAQFYSADDERTFGVVGIDLMLKD